jgi:hypothetical protein
LGCFLIYASLFGIGKIIFKEWTAGILCLLGASIAATLISRGLSRAEWRAADAGDPAADETAAVQAETSR